METNTTVENLRAEHARLDAIIREEESHIWKNLIRIEELKREKLRKKDVAKIPLQAEPQR